MKTVYDLIVVGGGVLGTFHAFHALSQGKSVLLIDKDSDKCPSNLLKAKLTSKILIFSLRNDSMS